MKRLFSLSPRLQAVADQVPKGARLADVGTDHGQLPVWLLCRGIVSHAVATDLRPGPLSRGQALAQRWAVADRVSFRLCDGLSAVSPEEGEVVIIAGMGGETIAGILAAAPWAGDAGHRYILQAMSGVEGLRRYLSDNGYAIPKEILVPEGDTLYVILLAETGKAKPLSEGEIWVGRQTRGMESPLRGRYLEQEFQRLFRAAEGLRRSRRPEDRSRLEELTRAVQEVAKMKKEWDQWLV